MQPQPARENNVFDFKRLMFLKKEQGIALIGAGLIYCCDVASKEYIRHLLHNGESLPLIPGVFQLTRVNNTGAAFSMFYQHPEVLTLLVMVLLGVFLTYMLLQKKLSRWEIIGFSCVIGGALGNLSDRLHSGAVTDFLDFNLIHYPIFNLADSFILIGMVMLLVYYVKQLDSSSDS